MKENNPNKAMQLFEQVLEVNSKVISKKLTQSNIALCYWKLGEIDTAIKKYHQIIDEYKEADYSLKSYSTDTKNIDEFIENNLALSQEELTTLGYLYILKKDYEKAEFYSKAALKLNDNSSAALDNIGQVYYQKGTPDIALEYFESALKIKETLVDSLFYIGMIYKEKGELDQAKSYLTRANSNPINGLNTITSKDIERELNSL